MLHKSQATLNLTCDTRMCLRFWGCPVVLDIEPSVSARHQKIRVLLCARRLVLLLIAAAASGSVRHKFPNYVQLLSSKITIGPIRTEK